MCESGRLEQLQDWGGKMRVPKRRSRLTAATGAVTRLDRRGAVSPVSCVRSVRLWLALWRELRAMRRCASAQRFQLVALEFHRIN